ncbi:MAG TPA: ATP-binding cassette domain-containing protein, partial [Oceanospirillales bacterium]|nr:ATP-binding cassette domain-containing protein [Oceanospirillales bacterium]
FGLENIIVIYLAAINVVENVMTIGMLFAFISYKRQFTDKISNLVEKFVKFKMMSLYLQRIGDIVLSECEPDLEGTGLKEQVQGDVSLRNITFRYADDLPVILENLSCEIKAGSSVAIVGPSGCGKTTLMKIILGLLKPTAGQVLIDGNDINKVGLRSYRQQIGTVMQDDALFSGTIADNICFFDHDRDTDYIRKCAEMAAIHGDIIAMPMGYNSLIGDMGSSLSGGQKQRLLLARALYKKPKIILLDEATSHLDTMLETQINQTIKSLNITRIVIAHRLETIESSEKVLVLFNGVITENDTKEYMSFFKK